MKSNLSSVGSPKTEGEIRDCINALILRLLGFIQGYQGNLVVAEGPESLWTGTLSIPRRRLLFGAGKVENRFSGGEPRTSPIAWASLATDSQLVASFRLYEDGWKVRVADGSFKPLTISAFSSIVEAAMEEPSA